MKNQALFSSKGKSKKLKCRLLQFLFGTLRVNTKSIQNSTILVYPTHDWRRMKGILANIVDPDQMPQTVASDQDQNCLP